MHSKKIKVQIMNSDLLGEDSLVLGEILFRQLKIPSQNPLQLSFGSFKQHIKVIPMAKQNGIRISQSLANKMGITQRSILRISYKSQTSTLQLGPIIGVLISQDYPQSLDAPFGNITSFCRELANACKKQGVFVYFFTPAHIGNEASKVTGWIYANGWIQTELPAAHVFYNRLTSRKLENKPSVQHFMKEVKSQYGSHFFNEKYLDKTEVFDALGHMPSLKIYMPESHLFRNYAMLKSMCSKYPIVFLKPTRGSLGKGIIRISRLGEGKFQTLTAHVGGTQRQIYPNLTKLFTALSGKMKTTRYQIQQGLTLMHINARPVDFRALVQKNRLGKWSVTSIVARIASNQHFVSNLARGGSLSTLRETISRSSLPQNTKAKMGARLTRAALDIAQGIDIQIPAHFGELGIDLAVDQNGRIWLLEVNSKPSKNDNTPLSGSKIRPSVKQVIEYSRFLSGF